MDWPLIFMFLFAGTSAVVDLMKFFGITPESFMGSKESRRSISGSRSGVSPSRSNINLSVILMLLTWGAVAYDLYDRRYSGPDPIQAAKTDSGIIIAWGLVDHEEGQPYQVQLLADGKRLLRHNPSFQSDYRLGLICFRTDGTQDYLDITQLQKSALYDIQNTNMRIILTTDDAYVEEWKRGARMTNYFLFLVPKGVEMNQFSTIRQAQALGAIQLAGRAGPP